MGEMGIWVPENTPPDEGYWKSLLCDGENGQAAPLASQEMYWDGDNLDSPFDSMAEPPSDSTAETVAVEDPWEFAREAMECGQVVELPVVGSNRGGVLVGLDGLRGFVPASHLLNLSPLAGEDERCAELQRLVGSRLSLKVIELDAERGRFVLSERASQLDESQRQELLDTLCAGDIRYGRVSNLCSFGAFVDLGGLEGLVHVSELSWGRVEHPGDVIKKNQIVEVYVLNIDRQRGRVGLSIKRLQPDPWQAVEDVYQVGQTVEGTITHIVDFGAFARIEQGLEGLIHISELADGNFVHPRNVVQEGDVVVARILTIDSRRRRMGLSIRRT